MAQHKELLQLFRDANFGWVFIGIESTDPASLKETLKTQNLHEDILTSVRRIYSYGIDVWPGSSSASTTTRWIPSSSSTSSSPRRASSLR